MKGGGFDGYQIHSSASFKDPVGEEALFLTSFAQVRRIQAGCHWRLDIRPEVYWSLDTWEDVWGTDIWEVSVLPLYAFGIWESGFLDTSKKDQVVKVKAKGVWFCAPFHSWPNWPVQILDDVESEHFAVDRSWALGITAASQLTNFAMIAVFGSD